MKRIILISLLSLPFALVVEVFFIPQEVSAQTNPRADTWREVREGNKGQTTVRGPETEILIQSEGERWRQLRNGPVTKYGSGLLLFVIGAIALFYFVRGPVKLENQRSGVTVQRWTTAERILHWYTATLFIFMAISGLILLGGKYFLIPLLGPDLFANIALTLKVLHNYLGLLFMVGVLLIIIKWLRFNIFTKLDWEWFKQGGGIVGNKHPSAGRMNGGEKIWFWLICTVGIVVCVSGLVLDFPNFSQTRAVMQQAHLIHAVFALIWIAVLFGHIYIGTIGTEGALEGMTTGKVDVEWAKQHHDVWYAEQIEANKDVSIPSSELSADELRQV